MIETTRLAISRNAYIDANGCLTELLQSRYHQSKGNTYRLDNLQL